MFPCMSTRTIECANNACQCVVPAIIGICVIDLICRVDTINCQPWTRSLHRRLPLCKRVQDNTSVPWLPKDARDDLLSKHEGHYNGPGTIAHRTIGNNSKDELRTIVPFTRIPRKDRRLKRHSSDILEGVSKEEEEDSWRPIYLR